MTSHNQPAHHPKGDEAPIETPPGADPSAACGAVCATSRGGTCDGPRATTHRGARVAAHHRAYGQAHVAAHGVAPSAGPSVALGVTLVGGLIAAPTTPPLCIDIDALFAFAKQKVIRLEQSILSSDDGLYKDICATICRSLQDLTACEI